MIASQRGERRCVFQTAIELGKEELRMNESTCSCILKRDSHKSETENEQLPVSALLEFLYFVSSFSREKYHKTFNLEINAI